MASLIEKVETGKNRVSASVNPALAANTVSEPVWVESPTLNFEDVAPDDAATPLLLNAAPPVWAFGEQAEVSQFDESLIASLETARSSMAALWPEFEWNGQISTPAKTMQAEQAADQPEGTLLLFSGGLDSTFSAFSLLDQSPTLLTVHGGRDLQLADDAAWRTVAEAAAKFADKYSLQHHAVQSNFTRAISAGVERHFESLPVSYWAGVQHGLGLVGVAAPAMATLGCSKLVLSATHSTGHSGGWGSHPLLDGVIRWQHREVIHYGYDHDRTAKVLAIVRIAGERGLSLPSLIVCTRRNRDGNCLRCPKCVRTLGSVLVSGVDPRELGFDTNRADAAAVVKELAPKSISQSDNERYAWGAISRAADQMLAQGSRDPVLTEISKLSRPSGFWNRFRRR